MSRKAFKYRLCPNREREQHLFFVLERARELYNAALQERKEAYKYASKTISYYEQKRDLPAIKELREEYKEIASPVLQDVILRVERAYQAFFRRVKAGEKAGYPRFMAWAAIARTRFAILIKQDASLKTTICISQRLAT